MKTFSKNDEGFEVERYELEETVPCQFGFNRRRFLQTLGGGIAVLLVAPSSEGQESGGRGHSSGDGDDSLISAWLHIDADGSISVFTGKTEVGQNIRTSLTQAVAEELPVSLESIRMVMADTDLVPWDGGTSGSRSTPQMNSQLRRVAATAREVLLDLAAKQFNTDRSSIVLFDGMASAAGSGEKISFGDLTKGEKIAITVSEDAPVGKAANWKVAGKSVPKINGRDFVTGRHKYSSDVNLSGMLHGRIVRPPSFASIVESVDVSAAAAMPNVHVVHEGDFVGVAATNSQIADRALNAIRSEWKSEPQVSRVELFDHLRNTGQPGDQRRSQNTGSMEQGLTEADHTHENTYTIAYIAHTPLEPRAAVADWKDGRVTVWTGTQKPFGVRSDLARALNLTEDRVRVIVPDTGSGYGGKHTGEAAIEAARLAQNAGKPVKVVWTREEEFTWAYVRPAGVIDIVSGVQKDGAITAWEFHNYNSGSSAIATPYDVPNQSIQFHRADSPLRQGSYRGLATSANNFARESHMDDLAHAIGMDPVAFRLRNLSNDRLRAVVEKAAEKFGWTPGVGDGVGIGCGIDKGSYVATCAEVQIDREKGDVRVSRLVTAFECGAVVNPRHLENQVEGAVVMGLGGALFEALDFADGRILNPRFSRYRLPRFSDLPEVQTVLIDRRDLPSAGAGETPIMAVAPAIGNAIFAATGKRIRSLPMVPNGLPA